MKNLSQKDQLRYKFNEILGFPNFGSKSVYRELNPKSDPFFSSSVVVKIKEEYFQIWNGDLDLADCNTQSNFKRLILMWEDCSIFIYKESTVHNETFNGRSFPYDQFDCCFYLFNQSVIMERKND